MHFCDRIDLIDRCMESTFRSSYHSYPNGSLENCLVHLNYMKESLAHFDYYVVRHDVDDEIDTLINDLFYS